MITPELFPKTYEVARSAVKNSIIASINPAIQTQKLSFDASEYFKRLTEAFKSLRHVHTIGSVANYIYKDLLRVIDDLKVDRLNYLPAITVKILYLVVNDNTSKVCLDTPQKVVLFDNILANMLSISHNLSEVTDSTSAKEHASVEHVIKVLNSNRQDLLVQFCDSLETRYALKGNKFIEYKAEAEPAFANFIKSLKRNFRKFNTFQSCCVNTRKFLAEFELDYTSNTVEEKHKHIANEIHKAEDIGELNIERIDVESEYNNLKDSKELVNYSPLITTLRLVKTDITKDLTVEKANELVNEVIKTLKTLEEPLLTVNPNIETKLKTEIINTFVEAQQTPVISQFLNTVKSNPLIYWASSSAN